MEVCNLAGARGFPTHNRSRLSLRGRGARDSKPGLGTPVARPPHYGLSTRDDFGAKANRESPRVLVRTPPRQWHAFYRDRPSRVAAAPETARTEPLDIISLASEEAGALRRIGPFPVQDSCLFVHSAVQ